MKESSKLFLQTLFNPDEEICVSTNKYANVSIPQSLLEQKEFEVESQDKNRTKRIIRSEDVVLISINPIKGDRNDSNVTAFRTFLVEMDQGDILDQKQYIENLKMPYSVCVFSGNKSLHYGITLQEDLVDVYLWRTISEWILAIVSMADQQTKSPSIGIRFPGNIRKDGNALEQKLVDVKGRVSIDTLLQWLSQYPDKNPDLKRKINQIYEDIEKLDDENKNEIPGWMAEKIRDGIDNMRNVQWFSMAAELAKKGHSEESIISTLGPFFTPDHDFTLKEWYSVIKSAVKRSQNR